MREAIRILRSAGTGPTVHIRPHSGRFRSVTYQSWLALGDIASPVRGIFMVGSGKYRTWYSMLVIPREGEADSQLDYPSNEASLRLEDILMEAKHLAS